MTKSNEQVLFKTIKLKPKKAISAFFYYQMDRRKTLKEAEPTLTNKDLIVKMSSEWKNITVEDKNKYNELATKDKERYLKEKKELAGKVLN